MRKVFCDICEKEITEDTRTDKDTLQPRPSPYKDKMAIEITTGTVREGRIHWNEGDYCLHCVLDAIRSMDNRPSLALSCHPKVMALAKDFETLEGSWKLAGENDAADGNIAKSEYAKGTANGLRIAAVRLKEVP